MTTLADLTATTSGLPCRTDPDRWFSPNAVERASAARECHRCPLLLDCMRYALNSGEKAGVWGGVDFEARAIGCGTERGYQSHKRRKEPVCPRCQAAHDEALEANRRQILAEAHKAGGTIRGYWMHRRLGEDACVPCKRACARQSQERRDREREAAERACAEGGARKATGALPGAQTGTQRLPIAS